MSRLRRHHCPLRTLLLVLLALGLISRPMLGELGDLHGAEHAAITAAAALGHAHDAVSAGTHHHHDDEADPEHSLGSHGLLHLCSAVTVALPEPMLLLYPPPAAGPSLPEFETPRVRGDPSSLPFRPPIA